MNDMESSNSLTDPVFLQELRSQMLRFASVQLMDVQLAEDAVQEALIGALKSASKFGNRAALKTWVFAILKNKISDTLRQKKRLKETGLTLSEDGEMVPDLFDQSGYWKVEERPVAWSDPDQAVHDAQFWKVFEACLEHLPNQQARVFMMREFLEFETADICQAVDITVSNLHVLLYRARLKLRECIENNWFSPSEAKC